VPTRTHSTSSSKSLIEMARCLLLMCIALFAVYSCSQVNYFSFWILVILKRQILKLFFLWLVWLYTFKVCILSWYWYALCNYILGTGESSQCSNPQSCSVRSRVADHGSHVDWRRGLSSNNTESLAADHSG
jgi:hypothetical protein